MAQFGTAFLEKHHINNNVIVDNDDKKFSKPFNEYTIMLSCQWHLLLVLFGNVDEMNEVDGYRKQATIAEKLIAFSANGDAVLETLWLLNLARCGRLA